jgi:TonB family protein
VEARSQRSKTITRAVMALAALLALAAIYFLVKSLMTDTGAKKRTTVHTVKIFKVPEPPPPKPEVKPPEVKKEEVKIDTPKPPDPQQAKEPPAGENLKMDTAGSGPGDGFGIQAGKGKDITTIGGTGGTGGSSRAQFAFYVNMIKRHFDEELAKNRKLRAGDYRVVVNIWLTRDGRIQRYELAGSSGNADTDETLKTALSGMLPLPEPPPESMPQPVRLRITARGAG